MSHGYQKRLPSTLFRAELSENYVPNTLREVIRHYPLVDNSPAHIDQAIISAIEENRLRDAKAIAQHYCFMSSNVTVAAVESGNLEALEWLRSIRKQIGYGGYVYMHTDVLEWLHRHGYLDFMSLRDAASTSAEGQAWCLRNNFSDEYIEDMAMRFSLQVGIYDEEYLLSRNGGRFNILNFAIQFSTRASYMTTVYPYWKEVVPRMVRHMGFTKKADLLSSLTDNLVYRRYHDVGNIAPLFSEIPEDLV